MEADSKPSTLYSMKICIDKDCPNHKQRHLSHSGFRSRHLIEEVDRLKKEASELFLWGQKQLPARYFQDDGFGKF